MHATTILYHDVIRDGASESSGFPGPGAARYKLSSSEFEKHLEAIAGAVSRKPGTVFDFLAGLGPPAPLFLTFDDGGASAASEIADLLNVREWIGHFLITADYIGKRGFVSKEQIRTLWKSGHVIGSHSCSHPKRMSSCSREELIREWQTSIGILSDILGEEIRVASVPGGYYSKKVARAASLAGIKALFNSEPTRKCHSVDGCLVLGRYTVFRGMSPGVAAGFASCHLSLRLRQYVSWNLKKVTKTLGGESYLKLREILLRKGSKSRLGFR